MLLSAGGGKHLASGERGGCCGTLQYFVSKLERHMMPLQACSVHMRTWVSMLTCTYKRLYTNVSTGAIAHEYSLGPGWWGAMFQHYTTISAERFIIGLAYQHTTLPRYMHVTRIHRTHHRGSQAAISTWHMHVPSPPRDIRTLGASNWSAHCHHAVSFMPAHVVQIPQISGG